MRDGFKVLERKLEQSDRRNTEDINAIALDVAALRK